MIVAGAAGLAACQTPHPPIATVDKVDLERFMGDWYVIANIPTFIERGAHNAVESYRLEAGRHASRPPSLSARAASTARPSATRRPATCATPARTRSGACSSSGPSRPSYRIVYLNDGLHPDGHRPRRRDYVWIMARTPAIPDADYARSSRCSASRATTSRGSSGCRSDGTERATRTRRNPLAACAALAAWIDSEAPPAPERRRGARRIDWLRVLPFLGLHLACLGVLWTGVEPGRARRRGRAVRAAHVRHHRLLPPLLLAPRVPHLARRAVRCSRCSAPAPCSAARCGGPRSIATTTPRRPPGDAHSPQHGFLWSHIGWFLARGGFRTRLDRVPDLARYPELRFLDRYDALVPLLLAAGAVRRRRVAGAGRPRARHRRPSCWSGASRLHGGALPRTFTINSLAHRFGRRRYATRDDSRNNLWLALLTFGEGWHNNHHHYPGVRAPGFPLVGDRPDLLPAARCSPRSAHLGPAPGAGRHPASGASTGDPFMKIAIIGTGIAGNVAAHRCSASTTSPCSRPAPRRRPHPHPRHPLDGPALRGRHRLHRLQRLDLSEFHPPAGRAGCGERSRAP
jgi:stearoyl-CoA desaturase (Delta-9 desaturase)